MIPLDQTDAFVNWKNYSCESGSLSKTWGYEYKNFIWEDMVQHDAIPKDNLWNEKTVQLNLDNEELFLSKGINPALTRHYMAFRPVLSDGLMHILKDFLDKQHYYNFLKLTPGNNLVWHRDTYATFVKFMQSTDEDFDKIRRTVVILEDWSAGQVIQIGNNVISHWQAGDFYTWVGDTWHGAANFGFDDFVCMQITWLPNS